MDVLGITREGRLVIMELKAGEDVQLVTELAPHLPYHDDGINKRC